ncbi:unnamed protein product [Cuscuta epithymum]|uniref:F-box domain-containing protein n=1 Tax=Cuscuta epithymum TaxID=186058 RepID=A0AAV0EF75_9ASTE|nr:unnamed protein product [Cuscuta epithymum]
MSDIPLEVVADFLSRVPAMSLLRFRCVSKQWRSIIDSPEFIKMHLNRTLYTKSDRKLILRSCYLYSADFDGLDNTNVAHYVKLEHPCKPREVGTVFVGSCHGLLCLDGGVEDKCILLWNPTTRKHFRLPPSKFERPMESFCKRTMVFGFGYDKASDDYKVLRILQSYYMDSEVQVFSMKSKAWRTIANFPYYLKYQSAPGVLVSGSLHWVVTKDPDTFMVNLIGAFDLETEEYRLVPQPDYPKKKSKNFHLNVVVLDGSLCGLCNYYDHEYVDVWVMKKYRVKESWTKLFKVAESDTRIKPFHYVTPVAFSRSGKRVYMVQNDKMPLWYDLEKKKVIPTKYRISDPPSYMEHQMCFGSLVQLDGGISGMLERVQDTKEEVIGSSKGTKKNGNNKKRDNFLSVGFKLVL